jgi:uncharacterized integral membrane protein
MKQPMPLVIGAVITVAVIALAAVNFSTTIALNLFGAALSVPTGATVLIGYVAGLLCLAPLIASKLSSSAASEKALTKWDAEDQKLLQQVQTDREKQLEAKIATLEAALNKALKKS